MSKIVGWGCGLVLLVIAAVFLISLVSVLPSNLAWGVVTTLVAAGIIFAGVFEAGDWETGTDSALSGCLVPVIAMGSTFFVLSMILGWSQLVVLLVIAGLLLFGFGVALVVSEPPYD